MTVCKRMCCNYYSIIYRLSQLFTFGDTFPSLIIALKAYFLSYTKAERMLPIQSFVRTDKWSIIM